MKIEGADQLAQLKEAVEDLYYFEFVFGEAVIRVWVLLVCGCGCLCVHARVYVGGCGSVH